LNIKNILLGCVFVIGLSEVVYSQESFDPLRGRDPLDPLPVSIFSELGGRPKMENGKYYIQWTMSPDTNFVSYRFLESMSEDMSNPTIDSTITELLNDLWGCYEVSYYESYTDSILVWEDRGCKGKYKIEVKDDHITKFWGNPSKYYQVIVKNKLGRTTPSEIIKW